MAEEKLHSPNRTAPHQTAPHCAAPTAEKLSVKLNVCRIVYASPTNNEKKKQTSV